MTRPGSMSRPLHEDWQALRPRLAAAPRVLVVCDYDGTLMTFVDHPAQAFLDAAGRDLLAALTRAPNLALALLSGRSLSDLQQRVSLPHVVYAGNHGLEISGAGLDFVQPTAHDRHAELRQLTKEIAARLGNEPGLLLEDKGLTVSVHIRHVPGDRRQAVDRIVQTAVARSHDRFVAARGHEVLEILPKVDWHKGRAARWIRDQLGLSEAPLICLGDDRSDEDVFAEFPDEITIKVGSPSPTQARYHVPGPAEVRALLADVLRICSRGVS